MSSALSSEAAGALSAGWVSLGAAWTGWDSAGAETSGSTEGSWEGTGVSLGWAGENQGGGQGQGEDTVEFHGDRSPLHLCVTV